MRSRSSTFVPFPSTSLPGQHFCHHWVRTNLVINDSVPSSALCWDFAGILLFLWYSTLCSDIVVTFYIKLKVCSYFILSEDSSLFSWVFSSAYSFYAVAMPLSFLLTFLSYSTLPLSTPLQANLLPGGFSVFWSFVQQGGNSGCEWHHIARSTQCEHPGIAPHSLEDTQSFLWPVFSHPAD